MEQVAGQNLDRLGVCIPRGNRGATVCEQHREVLDSHLVNYARAAYLTTTTTLVSPPSH